MPRASVRAWWLILYRLFQNIGTATCHETLISTLGPLVVGATSRTPEKPRRALALTMIGHDVAPATEYGLLHPQSRLSMRTRLQRNALKLVLSASLLLLVPAALFACGGAPVAAVAGILGLSGTSHWKKEHGIWHGVSLGGWLVMEINPSHRGPDSPLDLRPSWMYDQIEGASELDFVTALRQEGGDDYAIATMTNHWSGYYTDEMLDGAKALGVNTMRLPVGYWIMDAPVGGSSPLEYGISPEGFVTGGLNHLYSMLVKLKQRGIVALVDVHAMPCNSACVSNGLYCAAPLAFAAAGAAPIGDIPRCSTIGGTYPTTRVPRDGEETWGDVGVNAVAKLAEWIAALPSEASSVAAFQLANEPALGADAGLGAPPKEKEEAVNAFYERALPAARAHLPKLPLVLSFIPPTSAVMDFLDKVDGRWYGASGGGPLLADHHYYLNFQAPAKGPTADDPMCCMTWDEIHERACSARHNVGGIGWDLYVSAKRKLVFGEWSLAVNHDAPLDLSHPETRHELAQLFAEQLHVFSSTPGFSGAFFWTLRMGSGWDPRPTKDHPSGRQVEGSSAWKSLPGYPFPVWSLLEMAAMGIASPIDASHTTACAKHSHTRHSR